MEVIVL